MPRLSRRSFLVWIGSIAAATGFGSRARSLTAAQPVEPGATAAPPLDGEMLAKVAEVVLPSSLGHTGASRVTRAFMGWLADYHKGAELVHAYGNPILRFTGDSPAPKWRQQLADLQKSAREHYKKPFGSLPRDQREELVRAAISGERLDRLPDPIGANHVAVALIAWYFSSPDAIDLCYGARIEKGQCRPLVNATREPLPLAPSRGGPA
jgi:hypothetical protein